MTKYIAIAATNKSVIENWNGTSRFTNNALTQLAGTVSGKLVLYDFDENRKIGKVISGENDNGKLKIIVEMNDDFVVEDKHRIVPSFIVNQDGWDDIDNDCLHRTIKNAESMSYGLTEKPAEQGLPEIEKIKD